LSEALYRLSTLRGFSAAFRRARLAKMRHVQI